MKIRLDAVTKRFGAVTAVDRVSLEVAPGELFTLLGPSGCGKTTLLRLAAGFHAPDAGEIRFGDRRVDRLPPHARNIGMVFQNYALWPHMTVRGNVTYGLRLRRLTAAEIEARLRTGLARVNLTGLEDRYPISTPRSASRCAGRSAGSSRSWASPRSMSPTTRKRPCPSRTAWP
jgi:ABC-type Fe3+/spermidine/putrescine transport system ATPase subunit